MKVLRCDIDDLTVIAELERQCLTTPWSESDLKFALESEDYALFKAVDGGKIVGYGGVQTVLDEGNITNVAVFPDCRRRGYAGAIIEAIKSFCSDCGVRIIYLEVAAVNEAAIRLYEKHGFVKVYARKNYYKEGDAFVMSCEVPCTEFAKG